MNPNNNLEYECPVVEPELIAKFVTSRLNVLIQENDQNIPYILKALIFGAAVQDSNARAKLAELFFPSNLIQSCLEILSKIRFEEEVKPFPEGSGNLGEAVYRDVINYTLLQIRKVKAHQEYDYIPVIQCLGWGGLQAYPNRLKEFQNIWKEDLEPAEALEAAREVLWKSIKHKDGPITT